VPVTVVVQMQAKTGEGDRMLEIVHRIMPDTVAAEGAISFEAVRDRDDSDKFIVVGRWRERVDHETYMAWRAETGIGHDELAPVLETVVINYCDTVAEW
jgi:quinol monooxygenase YgiN